MYEELIVILNEDIARSQERCEEARSEGRLEDAALYAGKEFEARRIICLIMSGRIGGHAA